MDAVEFLKESKRMCDHNFANCMECPFFDKDTKICGIYDICEITNKEQTVLLVEKWSKAHPVKTRQSEFLKMFPNVAINLDGVIDIDPCLVDKKNGHCYCEKHDSCDECYKEYWLEEID